MMERIRRGLINREALYWLALAALLVSFFVWKVNHLEGFSQYDEGVNLMKARMMQAGYRLYAQIWSDQPPGFTIFLALALELLGSTVAVGRSLVVFFAIIGLLGAALSARELGNELSALVAVIMVAVFPHFWELSRSVMIGLPAIGLAVLAIAFALRYLHTGRQMWLILAGIIFSVSVLVKPITTFIIVPLILVIFLRGDISRSWSIAAKDLVLLASAVALPFLLCMVVFDGRALINQVIGTYLESKAAYPLDIAHNGRGIWDYLLNDKYGLSHHSLLALAAWGIASLTSKRPKGTLVIVSWLALTLAALLTHSPLRRHHLILLLFPLVIPAGVAVGYIASGLHRLLKRPLPQRAFVFVGLAALGLYLSGLPKTIQADRELEASRSEETETIQDAARFLRAMTKPEDFVIDCYPMITFQAGRKVPPHLCVSSHRRIATGNLTAEELIAITKEYDPHAILLCGERLVRLPTYTDWVIRHYYLARCYSNGVRIYMPCDPSVAVHHIQRANLGDWVAFLGYNLDDMVIEPGGVIHLTLYWQAQRKMDISYTVFVHLLDRENRVWGQVDNIPVKGTCSTYHWRPGETIVDEYEIAVHPDTPEGQYILEVGMYNLYTGKRLPIHGEDKEKLEDCIVLKTPLVVGGEELFASLEDIQHPMRLDLGDEVIFLGHGLEKEKAKPGEVLHLTLYWQAQKEMDASYTVFTHLLDGEGQIWGQKDSIPCDGAHPTTGWLIGKIIADRYEIKIAPDAPPGEYRIEVGMYLLETMERLPAFDEAGSRLPGDRTLFDEKVLIGER